MSEDNDNPCGVLIALLIIFAFVLPMLFNMVQGLGEIMP